MFSVKIRGVRVCADIGFLAVISLISLSGKSICGFSFLACILHELGHLAAIYAYGNGIRKIPLLRCCAVTRGNEKAQQRNSCFFAILLGK